MSKQFQNPLFYDIFGIMNDKFLKPYNASETEDKIYKIWEDSGFFNPDICVEKGATKKDAEPFSIILPPPNVTGTLHTGHASMLAIEDTMVRYQRMRGKKTLWIPGTDHAAIATQSVVEKIISKEKLTRHDLGREEFLKRVNEFAQNSHDTIVSQVKKMGASIDWSREAYTLDETREKAVRTAFKKMYDDELIYRDYKIVNWDPKGQTTVSDDEVNHEERMSKMYTFKYSKDFPISISTTRPETKVGDVAVAVHPEDERYAKYVGQEFTDIDFCGVKINIKIIADESVEKDFGTGALGVTPAHSQIDWEIAKRHDLKSVPVINEYAKISVGDERILGKKTVEAREIIVSWLREEGLLENEEDIKQNVGTAERSGGVIEPLPKLQWFINVNKKARDGKSLKDLMLGAVRSGSINILPNQFEKVYFNWIENLRDWNISRQIWFGHRIPVWYKGEEIHVGVKAPKGEGWEQDPDTLDTWFSSGLWTFSTLLDPEKQNEDLEAWLKNSKDAIYHPTSVLETGHDLIFFWIARMVLMSTYLVGEVPFKTVYLHGMVLDRTGKKMSKSRPETAIDPLPTIEKFGADALRMAMIVGVGPGQAVTLTEDKIKAYGKFANKIWNATRFVLENTAGFDNSSKPEILPEHEKFITEWQTLTKEITKEMDEYKLYLVGEKLYHFFWHQFADVIIEECKKDLNDSAKFTLVYLLKEQLKKLHPFMPFITEEIWGLIHEEKPEKLLIIEQWTA